MRSAASSRMDANPTLPGHLITAGAFAFELDPSPPGLVRSGYAVDGNARFFSLAGQLDIDHI
jgi:hypothetical protein